MGVSRGDSVPVSAGQFGDAPHASHSWLTTLLLRVHRMQAQLSGSSQTSGARGRPSAKEPDKLTQVEADDLEEVAGALSDEEIAAQCVPSDGI